MAQAGRSALDSYPLYEVTTGIEIDAQLTTKSIDTPQRLLEIHINNQALYSSQLYSGNRPFNICNERGAFFSMNLLRQFM